MYSSRNATPLSVQASSTFVSRMPSMSSCDYEMQSTMTTSSRSETTPELDHCMTIASRSSSNESCEEHTCSKCRMTEEEAKRLKAQRRKEQNRASQRRFRAKKENEIRGAADQVASMESMIQELQKQNVEMGQANASLMARVAELEAQRIHAIQSGEQSNTNPAQCSQCRKLSSTSAPDLTDYYWPIECTAEQQNGQLNTYLPLFDHGLMPYEV